MEGYHRFQPGRGRTIYSIYPGRTIWYYRYMLAGCLLGADFFAHIF